MTSKISQWFSHDPLEVAWSRGKNVTVLSLIICPWPQRFLRDFPMMHWRSHDVREKCYSLSLLICPWPHLNDADMEGKAGLSHRRVNNTKDNSPGWRDMRSPPPRVCCQENKAERCSNWRWTCKTRSCWGWDAACCETTLQKWMMVTWQNMSTPMTRVVTEIF